ncbi:PspC domain-containing protein [Paenibacillaceae bacterium]|nr:PspC domain-containing protein [Paenibacillaceae bacterium]
MKKLYRSTRDKKLLGLCGGVAEMMNIDATLLRVLFIVAVVLSSGGLILVYILAGLVVPKEPPYSGFGGGYNPYSNPYDSSSYTGGGQHSERRDARDNPSWTHWQQNNRPEHNQYSSNPNTNSKYASKESANLDAMMQDVEKKAMRKEIDELRSKLAKYEKGDY